MTKPVKRILFASDLSKHSTVAFDYAVGLAKAMDAEIVVVHVVEELSDDAKVTMMMFVQDIEKQKEALSHRLDATRDLMKERQDSYWASKPENEKSLRDKVIAAKVVEGFPAEEILRQAEKNQCDLIVLGAHRHGLSHTFLGTIAKRVLRRARIPTLVVPHNNK